MLTRRTVCKALAALPVAIAAIPAALARSSPVTLGTSPDQLVITLPNDHPAAGMTWTFTPKNPNVAITVVDGAERHVCWFCD